MKPGQCGSGGLPAGHPDADVVATFALYLQELVQLDDINDADRTAFIARWGAYIAGDAAGPIEKTGPDVSDADTKRWDDLRTRAARVFQRDGATWPTAETFERIMAGPRVLSEFAAMVTPEFVAALVERAEIAEAALAAHEATVVEQWTEYGTRWLESNPDRKNDPDAEDVRVWGDSREFHKYTQPNGKVVTVNDGLGSAESAAYDWTRDGFPARVECRVVSAAEWRPMEDGT